MKKKPIGFGILIGFLLIIITLIAKLSLWKQESTARKVLPLNHTSSTSAAPTIGSTDNQLRENIDDFTTWIYFNQDFQEYSTSLDKRGFRFKYPPMFEVENIDSGDVVLKKGKTIYLSLSRAPLLTNYPGTSLDEKFEHYYFDEYQSFEGYHFWEHHPRPLYEFIKIDHNRYFYKVVEPKEFWIQFGRKPENSLTRNKYIGVIDGHGIEIEELVNLPPDVIDSILGSTEFQ